jgi:cysteine-rich repeat protein
MCISFRAVTTGIGGFARRRFLVALCIAVFALLLAPAAARVLYSLASPAHHGSSGLAIAEEPVCGNGKVEPGEQCDDGNNDGGDCCSPDCKFEEADSFCDDGNACNDPDSCDGHGHCVGQAPVDICPEDQCHDPIACDPQVGCLNPQKANGTPCDDGDACSGDQCVDGVCIGSVLSCGDGIIESSCEYCDDGNTQSGDGCNAGCKMERQASSCQERIGASGKQLVVWPLGSIQACRNSLNAGHPVYFDLYRTQPLTDPADCPNEYHAAHQRELFGNMAGNKVARLCTDNLVRALPLCADTVDGLVNCLAQTHAAAVDAMIALEYGRPLSAADDKALQKCQAAIAKAGLKYVRKALPSIQKCRDVMDRGKRMYFDSSAQQPLTDPADCPNSYVAQSSIIQAGQSARTIISQACTDELVSALGLCAASVDDLVTAGGTGGCLVTGLSAQVNSLIQAEYRAR